MPRAKTLPLLLALAALLPAAPATRAQDAPAAAAQRALWAFPKDMKVKGRTVRLFEPIVRSYDPATDAVALRFALEVTDSIGRKGYGWVDADATAQVDLRSRLFRAEGVKASGAMLIGVAAPDTEAVEPNVGAELPAQMLLRLELLLERPGAAPETPSLKLNSLAPRIHVRRTPAVLVQIDGEPVLEPVSTFPLTYVANSMSDLLHEAGTGRWFLLLDGRWLESKALEGPWKPLEGDLPVVLTQLHIEHPRGHMRRWIAGTPEYKSGGAPDTSRPLPEVIVEKEPAELVLLEGDELFTMVAPGLKLQMVANTASDMLFHPRLGQFFLLIAGRWFVADDPLKEWKAQFGDLPEEFKAIPRSHRLAHVLACVPGTPEAAAAQALAALTEKAVVKRTAQLDVRYEGKKMDVAPLEGGAAEVVITTEDDVFRVGDVYYACGRGAWFSSADGKGRFNPVAALPEALRDLPASTGFLHDNACRPLGETDAGFVFSVSGGYSGVFPNRGAVVHGTGWTLRGLLRNENWYPRPRTWGENRWYDARSGIFQPRSVAYGEDGRPIASDWSPYTASYGRVEHYALRYHQGGRRMFTFTSGRRGFDPDASRPDVWETWATDVVSINGIPVKELPLGDRRDEAAGASEVVIADPDGNVLRAGENGAEQWKDGKWAAASSPPAAAAHWLDAFARINAAPAEWNAWRRKRAAPLPVNPDVNPDRRPSTR